MERTNPAVSIILPVYNCEEGLPRCVESILSQDYRDFELLLIDDGSTDTSGALCDEFALLDSRVVPVHQPNAGVSAARNRAMGMARGTYLQFVDSDDYLAPAATERLVQRAEETGCDLVVADFYRVVDGRKSRKGDILEKEPLSLEAYAACMMKKPADFYYGVLWNKLYRRSLVAEYGLQMNPELHWCEDFLFNLEYLRHTRTVCAVQEPLYYYVRTKGSLAAAGARAPNAARVKRTTFAQYTDFYKTILTEEEYDKARFQVYRYLIESAGDGAVPRHPQQSEKELYVSPAGLEGADAFSALYRQEKLQEALLKPVALRYGLTALDARLLLCLNGDSRPATKTDLADRLHAAPQSVSRSLQKLSAKGLLTVRELPAHRKSETGRRLQIRFLPDTGVEEALEQVRRAFVQTRLDALTPEEAAQYQALAEKIDAATRRALKRQTGERD